MTGKVQEGSVFELEVWLRGMPGCRCLHPRGKMWRWRGERETKWVKARRRVAEWRRVAACRSMRVAARRTRKARV